MQNFNLISRKCSFNRRKAYYNWVLQCPSFPSSFRHIIHVILSVSVRLYLFLILFNVLRWSICIVSGPGLPRWSQDTLQYSYTYLMASFFIPISSSSHPTSSCFHIFIPSFTIFSRGSVRCRHFMTCTNHRDNIRSCLLHLLWFVAQIFSNGYNKIIRFFNQPCYYTGLLPQEHIITVISIRNSLAKPSRNSLTPLQLTTWVYFITSF